MGFHKRMFHIFLRDFQDSNTGRVDFLKIKTIKQSASTGLAMNCSNPYLVTTFEIAIKSTTIDTAKRATWIRVRHGERDLNLRSFKMISTSLLSVLTLLNVLIHAPL